MTFKSDIHVIYAILKYNTDAYIKEVVRFFVLPMFNFNPYYDSLTPSLEVVANIVFFLWNVP